MNIKTIVTAAGLSLATLGCGTTLQQPSASRASELQCARVDDAGPALSAGTVYRAEPIHYTRVYAGGPQPDYVIGAKLYLPAEPGQSEASLERAMSCQLASGRAGAHPSDPLGAEGVRHVHVASAGSSFEVSIMGSDARSGEAVWQRARALAAQVGIQQVASSGSSSGAF